MPFNPIATILGAAGDAFGAYQGRKAAAEAGARRLALKKIDVKVARLEAKENRLRERGKADAEYDLQVLRNRDTTKMDEFLILFFAAIFALPFLNAIILALTCAVGSCVDLGLDDAIHAGWRAHGYDGAPWWFEFAMIGILVSTLGLMRLFRIFVESFKVKLPRGKK